MLAEGYFEVGQTDKAINVATKLSTNPTTRHAALFLLNEGYQRLALQSIAEIERLAPDSFRAYQLSGETHFANQNFTLAAAAFRTALDRDPDNPELMYALGRTYYVMGDFAQASGPLLKSISADPFNAEARFLMAEGLVQAGDSAKAVPYLKQALDLSSSMLKAHALLGKAYVKLERWEDAVKELNLASSTDTSGDLHFLLYRSYLKVNRPELAQKALAKSKNLRNQSLARVRATIEGQKSN
jgi:tetratricopeptide (TPR) repeat protein